MFNIRSKSIIIPAALMLTLTGCGSLNDFTQKVVEETKKTAHYTINLDSTTPYTLEQLLDEGKLDRVVFKGKQYELQEQVDHDKAGDNLGFLGKTYYVDQHGKRWTDDQLKQPYIYVDPNDIREKRPLVYGSVYQYIDGTNQNADKIVIEFNHRYYKAVLILDESA